MKRRIIARLDVKGPNVVKGIQFECLRVMGKPRELAKEYYLQGADELIYLDIVANLYRRQNLIHIVNQASEDIFIPFTIGGGIRSIEDIRTLLKAGADKVAINTVATKNPELLKEAAETFGSQCIVLSIEAKRKEDNTWEAYTDNGRESTGLDVVEWAKKAEKLGAGEIFLTSVDKEGTEQGYDVELTKAVSSAVSIPVIAGGGAGSERDVADCLEDKNASAAAVGSLLHYRKSCIADIKDLLEKRNIPVRRMPDEKRPELNKDPGYDTTNYNKYTERHIQTETDLHAKFSIKEMPQPDDFEIGIINYGINNVKSVYNALRKIDRNPRIITTPEEIEKAKALVLPGVGAFGKGMDGLRKNSLIEPIKKSAEKGIPILGICLGMQMLFTESEEFGLHKGLDLIPGRVVKLKEPEKVKSRYYRLPHIGWNMLEDTNWQKWSNTALQNTKPGRSVYFVHSFHAIPENSSDILASSVYGDQIFSVAVKKDNVTGLQFHPEKSGQVGIKILESFCRLNKL